MSAHATVGAVRGASRMGTMWLVVGAAAALVMLMSITSLWYSAKVSEERRAEQVAGCLRANVQRAVINEIILDQGIRLVSTPAIPLDENGLIPIPVCEDIIR